MDRGRREGRSTRCDLPCAVPAVWGSHHPDRTQSSKTPEFERTKGSHRLRYARVLRLEQNTPQQAPALFRICPVGELGRRVMRTHVCARSCLFGLHGRSKDFRSRGSSSVLVTDKKHSRCLTRVEVKEQSLRQTEKHAI